MARKLGFALLLVIFAATFVRLGIWQLDRANLVQEISKPVADKVEVAIETLIEPRISIPDDAKGRLVSATGRYERILKDINLEIPKGKFVLILGPSGTGKTTLLNIISGLDQITSGDNIVSDIRMAQKSHIFSIQTNLTNLTKFEKEIYKIDKKLLSKIFGTFLLIVSIRSFVEYLNII